MKAPLPLLLVLLGLWIIFGLWFYNTSNCCSNEEIPLAATAAAAGAPALVGKSCERNLVFDLNSTQVNTNSDFRFAQSQGNFNNTLSTVFNESIQKIIQAVARDNDHSVLITGYFDKDEVNNSPYTNLGLARAIRVKNYLAERGLSTQDIQTSGSLKEMTLLGDSYWCDAIDLSVVDQLDQSDRLAAIESRLKANPIVLYFDTNEAEIKLTDTQRQDFSDLMFYLDQKPEASISTVGHTDNTGEKFDNLELGISRAEFAKSYLSKSGLPKNRIRVFSKGQEEPIATNETAEGKAKNRRVVVGILQPQNI